VSCFYLSDKNNYFFDLKPNLLIQSKQSQSKKLTANYTNSHKFLEVEQIRDILAILNSRF